MKNVYILHHVSQRGPNDESVKVIGIYSSERHAKEAMERLKVKPGFSNSKEGFSVDEYELDKDHWTEGFL